MALGSNLNQPQAQVEAGLQALQALPKTRCMQTSRLYRSPPWGLPDQPDFINAVACLETELGPHALLSALQGIEQQHGRRRDGPRWGPRTLDLDLLLYDQRVIDEEQLQVPHPRMTERAFVLGPMAELAPDWEIPGRGTVQTLLDALQEQPCRPLD